MEVMVAKILLKFGAAQATCRDDDDHTTSQLFQTQHEKKIVSQNQPTSADVCLHWLAQLYTDGVTQGQD